VKALVLPWKPTLGSIPLRDWLLLPSVLTAAQSGRYCLACRLVGVRAAALPASRMTVPKRPIQGERESRSELPECPLPRSRPRQGFVLLAGPLGACSRTPTYPDGRVARLVVAVPLVGYLSFRHVGTSLKNLGRRRR
jgi:hypothetical protein